MQNFTNPACFNHLLGLKLKHYDRLCCLFCCFFVAQLVSLNSYGQSCANNKLSNASLENGTFSASTVNDDDGTPITTVLTTYGGSQALFLPFSAAPALNHPITGFKANLGYWINAISNGGTGAKDLNRLFAIPSNTGARCVWPNGMGFAHTAGSCYRVCFWVAQFDPAQPNGAATEFNFEFEDIFHKKNAFFNIQKLLC